MAAVVSLRPLRADDALVLASWQCDPVLAAHAEWRLASSPADAAVWWRATIAEPDPALLRLAIEHDGALAGYVDLHGEADGERELGYLVGPASAWGRGIATAAARAAVDHGFGELGLTRIWAEAVAANLASVRVLERIGMRHVGPGDAHEFLGAPSRYERFELLRPYA